MFESLFENAKIPTDRTILVHTRLRKIHEKTGTPYAELATDLLTQLKNCQPQRLLIPAFTIYSFMASRIFHLQHSWSEVGRFSEEIRRTGCPRSPDPMYSLLDIYDNLPKELDYHRTFGPDTVFEYLRQIDAVIVNVDMPGFYATPIHCLEMEFEIPYRFELDFLGKMQCSEESPWEDVNYHAYVRAVDRYGSGSYPPYNQRRRIEHLRREGAITEVAKKWGTLGWANFSDFETAIASALTKDPCFLVDQPA